MNRVRGKILPTGFLLLALSVHGHAHAQRTGENAVTEAGDAFGTSVGSESIGLYSSSNARGFNPSQAGNLRINGLYFDQAANPNNRIVRGNTVHVGISAQGYPFPAPTGVADFALRTPGNKYVTSVYAGHGALFSYSRPFIEIDTQAPVVPGKLSVGGGFGYQLNPAHEPAVRDHIYSGGLLAHWTPSTTASLTAFWSAYNGGAIGGDRPRVFLGDNDAPTYRQEDLDSPGWLFYGFHQYNYGALGEVKLPDQWSLKAGVFRSESNYPKTFTAFLLNVNAQGRGDYAIEGVPVRYTRSTSGEVRLSRTFTELVRRHSVFFMLRARDRTATFGGGDLRSFGPATIGAIPLLPEPQFNRGITTFSEARQVTGGVAYEGVWRNVGQLSIAVQRSAYERTVTRPGGAPVKGSKSPWLYNAGAAAYVTPEVAVYAGYTRGIEEIGTAPGNAINRDEAVPAELTRQVDAGVRYQIRPNLQFVIGGFFIDKPYYGLDQNRVFRNIGTIRHSGLEVSLAGRLTNELTVVGGVVALRPRITSVTASGNTNQLIAVGPIPRLIRVNLQYAPPALRGLVLDTKVESISSRFLNVANTRRIPGAVTLDAGVRYTTVISKVPVRFRLQGMNLTNSFSITPNSSGQIQASEQRRVEFSVAADF